MALKPRQFKEGLISSPTDTAATEEGHITVGDTDKKLKVRVDSANRDVLTNDQTQTVENKTVDGTAATGNNTVKADASDITFSNTASGLTAVTSQAAIDEVEGRLDTAETNIATNTSGLSDHLADTIDSHDASSISNIPSGNLAATEVQAALNELQTDVDTRALDSALTAHLNDAVDAHDASAISFDNVASGLTATETQAAVDELDGLIGNNTTAIISHVNSTNAHDAVDLANDPTGSGLTATTIQAAIDALDADINTAEGALTTHEADTSTHGVTTVAGISETQIITNKDIDGGTASNNSRLTVPSATKAILDTLTRKEGTILYATDEDVLYADDGVTLNPIGSGGGGLDKWVSGTTYAIDDVIWLAADDKIYVCTIVNSDVTFTSGNWQELSAALSTASELTNVPAGTIAATDVQAAINELNTDATDHLADAVDAHDASAISNVAAGNIVATDVQAAINELDGQDTTLQQDINSKQLDVFYSENFEVTVAADLTVTGTWTKADNTTTQISGTSSIKMTQAAGSSGAKVISGLIPLDLNEKNTTISLQGRYLYDGTTDIDFVIYDETNSAVLSRTSLPASSEVRTFRVLANTLSTTANISWYFEVMTENIGAILEFDNIEGRINPLATVESVESESYRSDGHSGYGSTNTLIPYFTNERINTIDRLGTITNNSTLGYAFTATHRCEVKISYTFRNDTGGGDWAGISLNSTQLTTNINSIIVTDRVASIFNATATVNDIVTWVGILEAGDTIRPHHDTAFVPNDLNAAIFNLTATASSANVVFEGDALIEDIVTYSGYTSGTTGGIKFKTVDVDDTNKLISHNNTGTFTKITLLQDSIFNVSIAQTGSTGGTYFNAAWYDKDDIIKKSLDNYHATAGLGSATLKAVAGDYIKVVTNKTVADTVGLYFSVSARLAEMPNINSVPVTNEVENVYSARIANNGTATITSESAPFIESVNTSATGIIDVVFKTGFFTVIPQISVSASNNSSLNASMSLLTTSGFTIYTRDLANILTNGNVDFDTQRQGADYIHPKGYFLGNLSPTQHVTTDSTNVNTTYIDGGLEYQTSETWNGQKVYARSWEVTTAPPTGTTLDTLPSGLKPINAMADHTANEWFLHRNTAGGTSTNEVSVRYDDSTGLVVTHFSVYTLRLGTIFTMRYIK